MTRADSPLVILVPYRDRLAHLNEFVPHIERFLGGRSFRILVIHQADGKPFNKGKLLNVGLSLTAGESTSLCLHDVDRLPLDRTCDYSPPRQVAHVSGEVDGFTLPYPTYFGGVISADPAALRRANGFSNQYWGWGAEDDDFLLRLWLARIEIEYRPGRFRSLPHPAAADTGLNYERFLRTLAEADRKLENASQREILRGTYSKFRYQDAAPLNPQADGLNTLAYELVARKPLASLPGFAAAAGGEHEIVSVNL